MSVSRRRIVIRRPGAVATARADDRPAGALVARQVARGGLDVDLGRARARAGSAIASRIASRRSPSRGRAPIDRHVERRRARGRPPRARAITSPAARRSRRPRGVRASAGKRRPRSPRPAAPSSASATAWSTTSPSEWPAAWGRPATSIPPRREPGAGTERMRCRAPKPDAQGDRRQGRRSTRRDRRVASP